jgi:hypothetical protein
MVVVARLIRGLLAGRDGEDLVAEVRASPVADPVPTLRAVALMAMLTFAALGFVRAVASDNVTPTAALHEIRTLVDL